MRFWEEGMAPLFTVPSDVWGSCYSLFYLAAFLVGCLIALYEGYRRKWPLLPWFIVVAWCAVWGVIGSKLLFISGGEWQAALSQGHIPFTPEKSFLGGILGGAIGVFLVRRLLAIRYSVADAFAFALPIGLVIGRIGCLLGGCCFGKPAALPWAIAYSKNSCAYDTHLAKGLITPGASASLPVHPTQLYEIAFLLALAAILWNCKKFLKRPGSLLYFFLIAYGSFRFVEEFVREGGSALFGLKAAQWGVLLFVLPASVYLTWRERAFSARSKAPFSPQDIFQKNMMAVALISIIIFMGKEWFTPLEMATLIFITLPAFMGVIVQLVRSFAKNVFSWAAITGIAASIIFAASSFDSKNPPDKSESSYYSFSLAGMIGQYEETCGPVHSYHVGGLGISRTVKSDQFKQLEFGLRAYAGYDENGGSYHIRGINPYVQADSRWVGFGVGIHTGDLFIDGSPGNSLWQVSLRIGPYDKFFVEGRLGDHFPGPIPSPVVKLGIGFGLKNDGSLRFGVSDAGFYVHPYLPLNHNLVMSPFFAWGDKNTSQLGITLKYKFGSR